MSFCATQPSRVAAASKAKYLFVKISHVWAPSADLTVRFALTAPLPRVILLVDLSAGSNLSIAIDDLADLCCFAAVRLVQIDTGDATVYYEYVRPPCVDLTFFDGKVVARQVDGARFCADPSTAAAAVACCPTTTLSAVSQCMYLGERVTFDTASARCASYDPSFEVCTSPLTDEPAGACQLSRELVWVDAPCSSQLQVDPQGLVTLVQPSATSPTLQVNSGRRASERTPWNA